MVFDVRHREDLMLFRDWFVDVLLEHCVETVWHLEKVKPRIDTHVVNLDRREMDVVVTCGGKRVCIELKDMGFDRAVHQAIGYLESGACDVAYVALNCGVHTIMELVRTKPELVRAALERGIGIVAARDGVLVFRAFQRRGAARRYANLFELVKQRGSDKR